MMKKQNRLRIACFLLFYFLMAFSSFGQRSDILVRIESIQPKHLTLLQHYPIKICFRTDSYFLGTVSRDVLSDMGRLRLSYEVIDDKPWTEPYYLITRSEKLLTQELITPGELIYQSATEAIIKVKDQKAFELAKRGVRLTRIFNQSLPLFIEETQPLVLPQVNLKQNDLIRDLVAQISDSTYHSFLQRLQDFQTRYSFSDSNVSARNWLREKFLEFGYTEVQFDPFSLSGTIQQNVVSTRPGIQGTNRVIIVGGHYDSIVFDGTNPMVFAPGVDDNGSGTAGTLEIARVLANTDLETTVMFIPFAAEEQGLWGSNHFAQSAFENGMNIDIVLNMDMIANVSDNVPDFNILTNIQSMGFAHLVFQMTEEFTNFIPQIGSSGGGSDHLPFQLYGYPALFLHEGDFSPNWHRATDVIANVDISYATEVLKSVVATVVTVANSPAVPSGLTAIEVGDGQSQILTWDPNQEADLAGYKIYLGPSSGSYTTVMTVTSSFDTLHNLMENEPVYAAVSAFDVDQNESLLSQEIMFSP
ncbi:MAG: M20/M25/M40 family metallo-hydrolase, partial [bacterium]